MTGVLLLPAVRAVKIPMFIPGASLNSFFPQEEINIRVASSLPCNLNISKLVGLAVCRIYDSQLLHIGVDILKPDFSKIQKQKSVSEK